VLGVGGRDAGFGYQSSVELFDPSLNQWSAAASMPFAHGYQTTRLNDGDILAAGEDNPFGPRPTAARFNEGTGTWTNAGIPNVTRYGAALVPLASGKVLYAAGYDNACCSGPSGTNKTAEIYDPAVNSWTLIAPLAETRAGHTGTLLANGKVLIAGGVQRDPVMVRSSAELFDPVTSSWTTLPAMASGRSGHSATRLANGKVLVAGGFLSSFTTFNGTAELFDPATNTWSSAGTMGTARTRHSAVLLPSGKVLVAGGETPVGIVATAEVYDPGTNTWAPAPPMSSIRTQASMVVLQDGRALVAGGRIGGAPTTTGSEFYQLSLPPIDITPPVISAPSGVTVDGTSPSGSVVTYSASATDDSGTVSSFACLPPSGSNFPMGDTLVTCTATDPSGNLASISFNVHVRTADEQLANLIAVVNGMGLPKGITNSLTAKVDKASTSNPTALCNQLNAFMNDVNAQTGMALTSAQAAQLILLASNVRAALGC
jgi:N-acetylneuraminic acid mutarotase